MKFMFRDLITMFMSLCLLVMHASRLYAAELPALLFPADCALGQDCWVVNYVDTDPAEHSARDFTCGPRTYDGHKGTDIAVSTRADMEEGVDVLAALGGQVIRVRDGETDTEKAEADLAKIKESGRECGNGVFIDHGPSGHPGLFSLYCHLKESSIGVSPGQNVSAGAVLGQIGHSGYATFPHVEFTLIREDSVIDPFTGIGPPQGCGGQQGKALWRDPAIAYVPVSLLGAGFLGTPPDFSDIKAGKQMPAPDAESPALIFWAGLYGVKQGDRVTLQIFDPRGRIFAQKTTNQEKTRARQYFYIGKRNRKELQSGTYQGFIKLDRSEDGVMKPMIDKRFDVMIR